MTDSGIIVTEADKSALSQDVLLSIPKYLHKTIFRQLARHAAQARLEANQWQPIETAWKMGDTPIIVTDGLSVHGGAWWHSREAAWLGCDGIVPTHWMPLPPPLSTRGDQK